ncbi:dihydroxyacetone kinase phosphoryl donor subunit DhaM [Yinghuangia soli]|uniref:phosphoenolpyruvate--glycerone phosphotransferase n=1 Tax=Yinghuangia soli TaxID=2908204 RepID=A0AA41Q1F0_9ACTN|nr:dihydroxyacetone kinase phosphoryl donor subunit DhaM [Yinghuangia soli]MCF2528312.1 PTS fructose transporter subunit IIA [Yinghuangia soli]
MGNLVGLVLVSHSGALAGGLREMIAQIGGDDVPVAVAAGRADGGLGTSERLVAEAIAAAEQGAGVVVLPDLGSAVLTVRALLAEQPQAGIRLVDAPFVEGAVAAAVTAASGADLEAVARAAEEARDVRKF